MNILVSKENIVSRPGKGMALIDWPAWGPAPAINNQLWVRTDTPTHKWHDCVMCGRRVTKERMYRPLRNPHNRGKRICCHCIET